MKLKELDMTEVKFRCNDCGVTFIVDCDEDEVGCCPCCTTPRVSDEGTNIERI